MNPTVAAVVTFARKASVSASAKCLSQVFVVPLDESVLRASRHGISDGTEDLFNE